jgi:hypothetical protein
MNESPSTVINAAEYREASAILAEWPFQVPPV